MYKNVYVLKILKNENQQDRTCVDMVPLPEIVWPIFDLCVQKIGRRARQDCGNSVQWDDLEGLPSYMFVPMFVSFYIMLLMLSKQ